MKYPKLTFLASLVIATSLATPSLDAARKGSMENPDFTKGDIIPEGATHDWTLGATGTRGWIYSDRMETPNYGQSQLPITRSLNALALLASGDSSYLPILKKEAEWASNYTNINMATWYYGYVMMFLSEYHIATGDDSVIPGLERLALEASNGQSIVGSWGHRFADKDGRLMGYGMMNAPGVTLTISLVLAREARVKAHKR